MWSPPIMESRLISGVADRRAQRHVAARHRVCLRPQNTGELTYVMHESESGEYEPQPSLRGSASAFHFLAESLSSIPLRVYEHLHFLFATHAASMAGLRLSGSRWRCASPIPGRYLHCLGDHTNSRQYQTRWSTPGMYRMCLHLPY